MLNDDRVKTRLLYGTDWTLLGRTPNLGPFYREQKALVYNTFGQSAEAVQMFVGRNAIDYLGLAKGQKTRGRLEAFYQKYDLDTWLFDLIDAVGGSSPSSGSVTRA